MSKKTKTFGIDKTPCFEVKRGLSDYGLFTGVVRADALSSDALTRVISINGNSFSIELSHALQPGESFTLFFPDESWQFHGVTATVKSLKRSVRGCNQVTASLDDITSVPTQGLDSALEMQACVGSLEVKFENPGEEA